MKKLLLFLLLICPIFVNAITYDSAANLAGNYMTTGDYKYSYTKYIYTPTNNDIFYQKDSSYFRYGGLLSYDEFMITVKNQDSINYSYLYESNAFWTLSDGSSGNKKIIDSVNTEVNKNNNKLRIGAKITEYVLPGAKVIGQGTYNDPFIFAPQYKVSIKVNNSSRGVLVDDAENEVTSIEFIATESDFRQIKIKSKGKYGYIGSTCGSILNEIQASSGILVLSGVTRDIECTINFGEKPTTVVLDQSDNNKTQVNPEKLYVVPESGWFSDEFGNFSISKLITRPEKLGYTYKGYYKSTDLDNACSGSLVVGTDDLLSKDKTLLESFTADQVLYPCHTANSYTVTFNLNSGDSFTSGSSTKSVTFDQPYGTLPVPQKTGYKFAGWWTDAEYGDEVENTLNMTTASDHTLYAHWDKDTVIYTIKYCKQKIGGGSAENTTNYPPADCQTETRNALSDTAVTTPKIDIPGFTKPTTDKTVTVSRFGDTTVYYYYTRNFINISFANSTSPVATPNFNSKSIQFGDSYSFPSISATGYTFAGWWTSTSGGEEKTTSKTVTDPNDHTLYPKFNVNQYTITIHRGTGIASVSGAGAFNYNTQRNISANASPGYTFTNWTGDINVTNNPYQVLIPAKNITVTANARGNNYNIVYNCNNGGMGTAPSTSSHVYGTASAVRTNTCTKTGFTFNGWNTKADGTGTSISNGGNVTGLTTIDGGTVTIYAQWKDTTPPSCTLQATTSGVSFKTKTDNVGVSSYGLIKSATPTYNSQNSLSLSNGTFYGYVTDAAGNTNKCSITIGGTYATKYNKTIKTCNRSLANYTRTSKTCSRSIASYGKTTKTCSRSVSSYKRTQKTCNAIFSHYNKTTKTCGREITQQKITWKKCHNPADTCTCRKNAQEWIKVTCSGGRTCAAVCTAGNYSQSSGSCYYGTWDTSTEYNPSCSVGSSFSCTKSRHGDTYRSACSVVSYNYYFYGQETNASPTCTNNNITCNASNYGGTHVSCTSQYTYSFGAASSANVSSCSEINFTCNASNANRVHQTCSTNYSYAFTSSNSTTTSCSVGSSFTCNSSNYGSSYVASCTPNYSYAFESATATVSSCTQGSSFTCNSSNYGGSYISSCSANYNYYWDNTTSSTTSCSVGSAISCASGTLNNSYVSNCTPTEYACSDSGYTKINNTYCYR